jgi:hypothetical protein
VNVPALDTPSAERIVAPVATPAAEPVTIAAPVANNPVAKEAPIATAVEKPAAAPEMPVATAPIVTAVPVAFSPVDQIPDLSPARAAPRQRKRYGEEKSTAEPLVFIETQPEKVQAIVIPVEEEAPRRRTPRPRKPRDAASEPLVFVETQRPTDSTPPQV